MPYLDWSQCPEVESVPGKVSGAWVLKGTRMPVAAILENIAAGASIDDLIEWFDGLDRQQVKAVIEHAARSFDKEPTYTAWIQPCIPIAFQSHSESSTSYRHSQWPLYLLRHIDFASGHLE